MHSLLSPDVPALAAKMDFELGLEDSGAICVSAMLV
jgi:hypothetical protein